MKEQSSRGQNQCFPCHWDSSNDVQSLEHMKKCFIVMLKSFLFLTFTSLPVLEGEWHKGLDSQWRWSAVTQLSLLDITRVQRLCKLQEEYPH